MANFNWFVHFQDAYIEHLSWYKSDHRPILLKLGKGQENRSPNRFIFLASWATDSSFKDVIKGNWHKDEDWPKACHRITEKIIKWNREVFGSIHIRKKQLSNRLRGIDQVDPNGTNPFLNNLQETIWKEYEKTLLQEEMLWCQRARHKWLQFGYRNTKVLSCYYFDAEKKE